MLAEPDDMLVKETFEVSDEDDFYKRLLELVKNYPLFIIKPDNTLHRAEMKLIIEKRPQPNIITTYTES